MANDASNLESKLKKADPQVKDYVSILETRNAKLQHNIVKLEADKIERDGRIKALEKELKKHTSQEKLTVNITHSGFDPKLPAEQLLLLLTDKATELGYRLEKIGV